MNANQLFEKPILFYSNYCVHSKDLLSQLKEKPQLFDNTVRVCIDVNPDTRKRPEIFYVIQDSLQLRITQVPTMISSGGEDILVGNDIFLWIKSMTEKRTDLTPFNPNEMMGLSDTYSSFGSESMNDASSKSYCFLSRELESINTPEETQGKVTQQDLQRMQNERESFKVDVQTVPADTRPQQAQLQPRTRHVELDKRLEQLMQERNVY